MTGAYNIASKQASKQGIIAPFFPVKLYLSLKGHLESVYAVRAAFLRSFEEKGG